MIARVALAEVVFAIDKLYDYLIPGSLLPAAEVGMRVSVPFARGNRRREGIIFELTEKSDYEKLKPIDSFLDEAPVISKAQLKLARWMKARFFCTYYEAVKAMLPAGLWLNTEYVVRLKSKTDKETAYLKAGDDKTALSILDMLYDNEGSVTFGTLKEALGDRAQPALSRLEEAGIIIREVEGKRRVSDKTVSTAVLEISSEEALEISARKKRTSHYQSEILKLLSDLGEASVKELCYYTGASASSVKALEKAGYISLKHVETFRRPDYSPSEKPLLDSLNAVQQEAYEGISSLLKRNTASAALLYGITGSGKTAVYIKLIRDVINSGGHALALVPEIALTPQLVSTFYQHFGDRVAVLHSSLSLGERYDEWKRIKAGLVDAVVGTRSAVFAPLTKLRLLIIDEEQEYTYKSENAPRYHARDIAKYLCVETGALLLLGSATPSVESMYSAKTGKYKLFRMDRRYNEQPLPNVIIADMKEELKKGNGTNISSALKHELDKNLCNGEQSILFINRRCMSSAVYCPECGLTYDCPRCSAHLTYHSANRRMMCHYCGYSLPVESSCPGCGGKLNYTGTGTQRVEAELHELYPDIKILRMDTDTVSASRPHEAILSEFEKDRVPILIGTQMVTKGLNFDNVTLVGVISADQALYSGDFRAHERTFSLITQVVGRSGRGAKTGRAVIQTFTPNNEVIQYAARQDYDAFYESEIQVRSILSAPPVKELYTITVTGAEEGLVLACLKEIRQALLDNIGSMPQARVLGPAPVSVVKVNNRFRYRIILNTEPSREARQLISGILLKFSAQRKYKGLLLYGDVNPID
jgi:primosomal protein N' (replication factor Y)